MRQPLPAPTDAPKTFPMGRRFQRANAPTRQRANGRAPQGVGLGYGHSLESNDAGQPSKKAGHSKRAGAVRNVDACSEVIVSRVMKAPSTPPNEAERLADLYAYEALDTAADAILDGLTRLATELLGVPIALVSLVDAERQWFKSRQGLPVSETPRSISFCGHVVAEGADLLVADATRDPRFADNPLVVGEPRIRFYAGVALRSPRGHDLGTFCVIDHRPRDLSPSERRQLASLAELAMGQLDALRQRVVVQRVVDAVPGMLGYWDRHQLCQFANAAYHTWFGVEPEALLGRPLADLLGPIYPLNKPYIEAALRGDEQMFEREIPDPRGGPARHSQAHYVPDASRHGVNGFAVMVTDISVGKRLQQDLRNAQTRAESLARHDTLTGLPNRVSIDEQLDRLIVHAQRYGRRFAVLYLDLDGFKFVNDTMGHAAGDDVLREVAQRLLGRTRKSDTVGRLGGDEFIVVLPEFDDEGHVQLVAQKLLATVTTPPIMAAGRASGVSLSIGIATFPNDGSAIAPLLAAADAALYEAKRLGKNRFAIKTQRR